MALPVDYDTVPVRGKYVYLDGSPVQGAVKFTGKVVATSAAADTIIIPATITAQLGADGSFTVGLPATDDPDIAPGGWTYKVTETFSSGGGRTFEVDVPIVAKATGIDLSDVAPTGPSQPGDPTAFVTLSALADVTANFARTADFRTQAAGGVVTSGQVIVVGDVNDAASDIATAGILAGGTVNYENVLGGDTSTVNTPTSNVPAQAGKGADWSFILGGYDNVVNGSACQVQGYHCKVEMGATHGTIAGGSIHTIDAGVSYSTLGGGTQNRTSGNFSTVSGGLQNTASVLGSIGGGQSNNATADTATIAGGNNHDVTGQGGAVCGGNNNNVGGGFAGIHGGQNNTANGASAFIGGGSSNTASNSQCVVAGGTSCTASAISATVGGGQFNIASGVAATVVGGRENTASGAAATAIGREANASMEGMVAFASGKFAANGDAQAANFVMRRETTTATQSEMFLNGSSGRLALADDSTWTFRVMIAARRTDADNESAGYEIKGVIDRNSGAGTTALVGTPTVTVLGEDNPAWDVAADADTTNGSLRLRVTGEASKTIRWVARVELVMISG